MKDLMLFSFLFFTCGMSLVLPTSADSSRGLRHLEECSVNIQTTCHAIAATTRDEQQPCCKIRLVGETPCLARPSSAIMQYNGWDCTARSTSSQQQGDDDGFSCQDSNGGPPALNGNPAYIVLTDAKGRGITYFEGAVEPGHFFTLNNGGERFEANQMIHIFDDASRTTLYQEVIYHSSASNGMKLQDVFGANILAGFYNDMQGSVTCSAMVDLDVDVVSGRSSSSSSMTLSSVAATQLSSPSLFSSSNMDLSTQQDDSTTSTMVTLSGATIDTLQQEAPLEMYTVVVDVEGTRTSDGAVCTGKDSFSFTIGNIVEAMAQN